MTRIAVIGLGNMGLPMARNLLKAAEAAGDESAVEKVGAENYQGPGLVVQWVDVEGPLLESWPPPSHRRLFGEGSN